MVGPLIFGNSHVASFTEAAVEFSGEFSMTAKVRACN